MTYRAPLSMASAHGKSARQINVVWHPEDERIMTKLQEKTGLTQSGVLRLALRKLAQLEGII